MAVLFIPVLAKVVMVWMLTAYGLQHDNEKYNSRIKR
jgi:hypothetical protein